MELGQIEVADGFSETTTAEKRAAISVQAGDALVVGQLL
jgi:hypothetical protein